MTTTAPPRSSGMRTCTTQVSKTAPVDGAVDHERGDDAAVAQTGDKSGGFPIASAGRQTAMNRFNA